jgi:putative SOS response-associated peptidase YedK
MFRDLLRERRCAVPIDGYYEWRTTSSGKAPFWFSLKSGEPFFLAGLWDRWHEGRPDEVASYILMTTRPNELAAKVHDRMPVLLHARDVERWLDPSIVEPARVADLLGPYPAEEMASRPVSRRVSNPDNEGPELIEPDDPTPELWA